MKRNRVILLALLIPLLLDLLVVFTVGPIRGDGRQTRMERATECSTDFTCEAEVQESAEEDEVDFIHVDWLSPRPAPWRVAGAYLARVVLPPSSPAARLASGWSMPLRI